MDIPGQAKCPRYCTPLLPPDNGSLNVHRHIAFYRRDDSFRLVGSTCAAPPVVKRGYFEEKGLTAKYACKRRHSMIGNSTILYNASSSTWASPATCLKTGCPDLHHPLNGIVHYNKKLSQVHYTCNQGYLLFGSPYRSCNETTGCLKPVSPKNGGVTERENEATYDCDYKFALLGAETLTCNESGKWSAPPPVCKKPKCGLVKTDYSQRVTFSEINETLKATFTCRYGQNLFGNETKICNANDMRCLPFLELYNGNVVQDDVTATYSCNDGFRLVGSRTRTCGKYSGEWSRCPPVCSEDGSGPGSGSGSDSGDESEQDFFSTCCSPPSPPNGSVVLTSPRKGIRLAHYFCNNGFRLIERGHTRECNSSFNFWSPSFEPSCTSTCPSLSNPRNGEVLFDGSRAVYSCHAPLILYGNKERLCSNVTRQWIGESPVCLRESSPTSCPPPPDLVNGRVEILSDFFPFSVGVKYARNDGYRLVGISDNHCSDVCPPPPRLPNEFVQEMGSVATYICSDWNIFMFGDATITCNAVTK
ncbi:sushi, von Willebrand factor type A, EGF and pentraxin domain-containing protein 1-like [Oscarella lobularis]|uniref:sushi, von Willebrand factor type A, EGF and pentraxin domain-containing protein 1-like n=1 Tax=Oscarella lobularis TaxID=121494 RepID=UPI00331325B0